MRRCRGSGRWCLAVCVVVASACGGSGDAPTAGEPAPAATTVDERTLEDVDACTLLTAEEIQAATGLEPAAGADPVDGVSAAAPICAWPSRDGRVHQVAQVLVSWSTARDFEEYRRTMEQEGMTGIRRLEGPGRFTAVLEDLHMVQVFGERYMVQTMASTVEGRDRSEAAATLARAALARLE